MLIECRGERKLESATCYSALTVRNTKKNALIVLLLSLWSIFIVTFISLLFSYSCILFTEIVTYVNYCKQFKRTWYTFILQFWLRTRDRHLIFSFRKYLVEKKNRENTRSASLRASEQRYLHNNRGSRNRLLPSPVVDVCVCRFICRCRVPILRIYATWKVE